MVSTDLGDLDVFLASQGFCARASNNHYDKTRDPRG